MKLMIAGDWHTNHNHAWQLMKTCAGEGISVIIQVGDFGFMWTSLEDLDTLNDMAVESGIEVWWLDGNHENYSLMSQVGADHVGETDSWIRSNIRYLPRGFRFEVDGCRFMAFGGAISMDRNSRQGGVSYFFQEAITTYQADAVTGAPVDIFLSHDVPDGASGLEFHDKFSGSGWPEDAMRDAAFNRELLAEVVDRVQPKLIVHGHYHRRYQGTRRGAKVVGLDRDDASPRSASYVIINTEDYRGA